MAEDPPLRYIHWENKTNVNNHLQCQHCRPNETIFCDNYISTTKYTFITFLPINLWLQFNKKANVYFLIVAILSFFPLSPKQWWVSVVPLVFVLAVSAIKEAFEDLQRYKMDQEINNDLVQTFRNGAFTPVAWKDVKVGDMIKVEQDKAFPADLLLLQSSANNGICNIETANLDGETNLKIKKARPQTYQIACSPSGDDYPRLISAILESDAPNENMESSGWKGNLHQLNGHPEPVPLVMEQMLLRGCTLRNTKWIIGLVAFTGRDTKLMLNNKATVYKRSMVEKTVDTALYVIFSIQALLCVFGSVANYIWMQNNATDQWYLPFRLGNINISQEAGLSFFTYLVLLDLLVPISLYVSMELVKVTQVVLIDNDLDMYHDETDTPAKARTSNLNEELGQVDYIFSDKTGTLTRNMMEFLRCTVDGISYGPDKMREANVDLPRRKAAPGIPPLTDKFRFEDNRLLENLITGHKSAPMINEFLTLLAACHTVIPEYPGCAHEKKGADPQVQAPGPKHVHGLDQCTVGVQYQAASPDEKALVEAAKSFQYYFKYRAVANLTVRGVPIDDSQIIQCNFMGQVLEFEILAILEFTSHRKRMSVVLRDPRDNLIKLYCKGADTIVYDRLSEQSKARDWEFTFRELEEFAKIGLRTLVCAYKVLSEEEFLEWYRELKTARSDMQNRAGKVANAEDMIERNLTLVGSTAIEDRLQDGVPDCIANLARAGIKIWILTGDKVETAINIGRSCRLLTNEMRGRGLLIIDIDEKLPEAEARRRTEEALADAWNHVENHQLGQENQGLVISGRALGFVFPIRKLDNRGREIIPGEDELKREAELQTKLFEIAIRCKAVVCCRVSPKQKSQVVLLVKERVDTVTLAIGDGANDVPMIKAAHVGIGISGQEGLQAVMASDYAIAQFRFLETLLLVHGARSYRRIAILILYSFYKNITISFTNMLFAFYSGFSGQMFYDSLCGSLYNMVFTAFPVMSAAVFNNVVNKENCKRYPQLYKSGQRSEHFNLKLLFMFLGEGVLHGIILFFWSAYLFGDTVTDPNGQDNDHWLASTAMFSYMVFVVNLKIALETTTWVWWSHFFFWGSLLVYFFWLLVYCSGIYVPDMYYVSFRMFRMGVFWWGLILVCVICMLPDFTWKYVQRTYFPSTVDIILEQEQGFGKNGLSSSHAGKPSTPLDTAHASVVQLEVRGADEDSKDGEVSGRVERWKASRGSVVDLGYCNFMEDGTNADFVMGQNEFLRNKLEKDERRRGAESDAKGL
eukprot:TRINITY_DN4116_c0_g3_i2.p1 TRINITY_DN4116_c0_g3~~TRINITY_DN4116_c0_g3_i2.p1  ORF type:complete len:1260 (-),score=363.04 TRINITY_DN4116_c0_g3_i2:462-4241(-)